MDLSRELEKLPVYDLSKLEWKIRYLLSELEWWQFWKHRILRRALNRFLKWNMEKGPGAQALKLSDDLHFDAFDIQLPRPGGEARGTMQDFVREVVGGKKAR